MQAQTSLCKYVQVCVSLHAQVFTRKFKVISNKFAYTQTHTHTGTHTHTVIDVCASGSFNIFTSVHFNELKKCKLRNSYVK